MATQEAWQLMTAMLLTIETQALDKSSFSNSTLLTEQKSAVIIKLLNVLSSGLKRILGSEKMTTEELNYLCTDGENLKQIMATNMFSLRKPSQSDNFANNWVRSSLLRSSALSISKYQSNSRKPQSNNLSYKMLCDIIFIN